jgi:hypothetical protein
MSPMAALLATLGSGFLLCGSKKARIFPLQVILEWQLNNLLSGILCSVRYSNLNKTNTIYLHDTVVITKSLLHLSQSFRIS